METITKNYYFIDTESARLAHYANSFREFDENRQLDDYAEQVDDAWAIVESKTDLPPETVESLRWLADRYARRLAKWYNDTNRNESSCPSIMISGGGNFPVAKKNKQNARRSSLHDEYKEIENLLYKLKNIANANIIKSNNPNAIELLELKLEKLQAIQQEMKSANAWHRKHGTMLGFDDWTPEQANAVDEEIRSQQARGYSFWAIPFPQYALTNNNQNIARIKKRIDEIKRNKDIAEQGGKQYDTADICEVIENSEQMRIQLLFDGKPSEQVRKILKKNGFCFSFKNTAWQRLLNNNGRYAVRKALEQMKELNA